MPGLAALRLLQFPRRLAFVEQVFDQDPVSLGMKEASAGVEDPEPKLEDSGYRAKFTAMSATGRSFLLLGIAIMVSAWRRPRDHLLDREFIEP
jgi:hypothetical protein